MAWRGGSWGLLQDDVSNAFNSIDRTAMLRGARRLAPHVEPWLHWCYGQAVPLYSQGLQVCESVTGVHQGDAMGPLGFALGLEEALEAAGPAGNAELG